MSNLCMQQCFQLNRFNNNSFICRDFQHFCVDRFKDFCCRFVVCGKVWMCILEREPDQLSVLLQTSHVYCQSYSTPTCRRSVVRYRNSWMLQPPVWWCIKNLCVSYLLDIKLERLVQTVMVEHLPLNPNVLV